MIRAVAKAARALTVRPAIRSDPPDRGLVAQSVRDELEDLHWLAVGGTAQLEQALARSSLWLGACRPGDRPQRQPPLQWMAVEDALRVPRLAVFTGADRMDAFTARRPIWRRAFEARLVWRCVATLGFAEVFLDPGHSHGLALTRHHLQRLSG